MFRVPRFTGKGFTWTSLLVLLAMLMAACQPAPTAAAPAATNTPIPPAPTTAPTDTAMPPAPTATTAAMAEAMVNVATDPKLGKILVDGKGMTLYMFTKDTADTSNCSGGCLKAWPALATQGSPKAGDGVNQAMLGSAKLADGSMIVTYNHMPLYYYAKDTKPGDTTGQGVGSVWYVVGPDGNKIDMSAAADTVVNVATDPKLGKILVDSKGMTLYMYTKDTADTSTCSGGCLKAWPALATMGSPKAGDGVDQTMLGSAKLADGSMIVTYNHMPLYYFAKDTKPGDTTGQGVGSVWYVVGPDGNKIDSDATSSAASGTVNVATDPKLGKILVDSKGMTLYMFTKDTADTSNCSGGCLTAWPPLKTDGSPKAGDGVDQSMLGSAKLADGSMIVTYNHMPLYYYAKDTKMGDTTGQGVGSVWYVVGPDGKKIDLDASSSASSDTVVNVATNDTLGKFLVDSKGMTLYMFTKDTADTSNCSGGCLTAWPPLKTAGSPKAGDGVDQSMLGTAKLADGSMIVTYNHMPLYYYAKDTKAGDTTGQGVGSVWYVVGPDGMSIQK